MQFYVYCSRITTIELVTDRNVVRCNIVAELYFFFFFTYSRLDAAFVILVLWYYILYMVNTWLSFSIPRDNNYYFIRQSEDFFFTIYCCRILNWYSLLVDILVCILLDFCIICKLSIHKWNMSSSDTAAHLYFLVWQIKENYIGRHPK